jgi:hypothetical protein
MPKSVEYCVACLRKGARGVWVSRSLGVGKGVGSLSYEPSDTGHDNQEAQPVTDC